MFKAVMRLAFLCGLNVICLVHAVVLTLVFQVFFLCFLVVFLLMGKGGFDDVLRYYNAYYGAFMVRMFWPIIRVRRVGMQQFPTSGPVMMVTNHRSFFDIFFFGFIRQPNVAVLVRSWPFRLPVLGTFMRGAGYIDIECQSFDMALEHVRALTKRGVSSLCFPEGHRSRDGRLQRFGSGAFRLAAECDLPVVPICITGTEKLCAPGSWLLQPASVNFEVLPAVDTTSFPAEKRALKLRRHVEKIFGERIGE